MTGCCWPKPIANGAAYVTMLNAAESQKDGNPDHALLNQHVFSARDDQTVLAEAIGLAVYFARRRQWERAEEVLFSAFAQVPKASIGDAYIASIRLALHLVLNSQRDSVSTDGADRDISQMTMTRVDELWRRLAEPEPSSEPPPSQMTHDYAHAIVTALRLRLQRPQAYALSQ